MSATKSPLWTPALIPAMLLALIVALSSFSHATSAQPRRDDDPAMANDRAELLTNADGESGIRGCVVSVRLLPGEPSRENDGEPPAQEEATPPAEEPAPPAPEPVPPLEQATPPESDDDQGPDSKRLALTIPKLEMKGLSLGSSPDQAYLDREGIMHLADTDFPWQDKSNTYIVGHAIGYPGGRVPYAFRRLADLREGDRVTLRDADGKRYDYRVYQRLVVDPTDYWVTRPVRDKDNIVSLQTCYPEPTFERRLVVRAELVEESGE